MALLYKKKVDYIIRNVQFYGISLSLLKGILKTCAIHTQVNRQASVARILLAGSTATFSTSVIEILLDAQISEYNKTIYNSNTYGTPQDYANATPTAPSSLHNFR